MKSTLRLSLALVLVTFLCSQHAYAWFDSGHMAVAYIAYQKLNPATRARVNALIKLNPSYTSWLQRIPAGASEDEKNEMIFMIAATWADEIKDDGQHNAPDGDHNGNTPPAGPIATANIGYSDQHMHKYWHYVDLPFSPDGTPTQPPDTPNALTQIKAFREVLKSTKPDPLKSYDLVWLMHIVGDVHQPLHCTARFTSQTKHGDAGGNLVTACNPQCDTLHAFWDGLLGTEVKPDPQIVIDRAKNLPAADPALAVNLDASVWIKESFLLAKQNVYHDPPIGPGKGPFPISADYEKNARAIASQQVPLAGERLANILNAELK